MATEQEQQALREERIAGVRTLQDLGVEPRDTDPVAEEDARFGAWPAGSIQRRAQQIGLEHLPNADGEGFLNRAVHEESISLRMERDRGVQIGDDLVDASSRASDAEAVAEQGRGLKGRSLRSYWDNREELLGTVKAHPAFQLGNQALTALVALDEDGRVSQLIGDPRAKLAILAAKELHAGVNDPSKSRISQMLSGDQAATDVVLETAAEFAPAKAQPFVQPAVKAAQAVTKARKHLPEKAAPESEPSVEQALGARGVAPGRIADIDAENSVGNDGFEPGIHGEYGPSDRQHPRVRPVGTVKPGVFDPSKQKSPEEIAEYERTKGPSTIGSGPSNYKSDSTSPHITRSEQAGAQSVSALLNTQVVRGQQVEQDAAARQRRMTAMLNGEDSVQQTPQPEAGREFD